MLKLKEVFARYGIVPKGVIHIGAHEGSEVDDYLAMGFRNILFIEANPDVFVKLEENLQKCHLSSQQPDTRIWALNLAISNRNGTEELHVTNAEQSSSILPLHLHKTIYPGIKEIHRVAVPAKTLDTLMEEEGFQEGTFNFINIDIQGAELMAFQGARNILGKIDAVNTEINYIELYKGCALADELDEFLENFGFHRVETIAPYHPSWGDAFYIKKASS